MKTENRWVIAIADVFLQIVLGAVDAWSVFRIPLSSHIHIHDQHLRARICCVLRRALDESKSPRVVVLTPAVLYGVGVFLASFSANKLWWLYLSYGFIGGQATATGVEQRSRICKSPREFLRLAFAEANDLA